MEINLRKLKFGNDDAERDAKQGFLNKVFLKTDLYERIKTDQCELVIGRKGAGKSATCLILKNAFEKEGMKVALLTPESLSQQKIQALRVDAVNKEELYLQTWKYILLVKISFEFLSLYENLKIPTLHKQDRDLKVIYNFLKAQGEAEDDFRSSLSGLFKVFSKISIDFAGFKSSIETNQAKKENDLMDSLARLELSLCRVLKLLNDEEIFVLIDKVDEIWDDTEESKLMVSGLLRATHTLNDSLPNTKTMVFLRSDIFDVLKFHDIDKLNSLSERITWSESDLKQLIENRIRISIGLDSIHPTQEVWEQVFDKNLKSQSSFKYIISRTLRRPRETIQFCNKALRIAQDSHHEKILSDDILSAEIQYSVEKIRDLASEFLVQYPYLEGLFSIFQGFQTNFTKREFELRYEEARTRLEKFYLDLQSISSDGIIQILYNIGFLGAEIDSAYVFSYNMPNLTLPQQEKYIIHFAFHSALGIQERIVVLDDFQQVSIVNQGVFGNLNVGGIIGASSVSQKAFGDQSFQIGRSIGLDQEELLELLLILEKEFQKSNLNSDELDKALIRIEAAKEEVIIQDPDKEFVGKCIKRAFEVFQENGDDSSYLSIKDSRKTQLAVRGLSRWLGVSSGYFEF